MNIKKSLYLFFYAMCFASLASGSRFMDGGLEGGLLRSLHGVDLIMPFILMICLKNMQSVCQILSKKVIVYFLVWVLYALTLGQTGNFVSGLADDYMPLFVGLLFAFKELEFFLILVFSAYVSFLFPKECMRIVGAVVIMLSLWLLLETFNPTGFYYVGLPFEKGAMQTGTAFGFIAIFLLIQPLFKRGFLKLISHGLTLVMILGVVFSLSRTALLSFLIALFVLALLDYRILMPILVATVIVIITSTIFSSLDVSTVSELALGRWSEAGVNSLDRFDKWNLLFQYISSNLWYTLFGAGFGSPNALVLGNELGYILAVDSAYVRRIFEVGFFGTAIYYVAIFMLVKFLFRNKSLRSGIALTVLFMVAGITVEASQVTQSAGLFFFLSGTIVGLNALKQYQSQSK